MVCADVFRLPFADGSIAAIASTNFIEHIPEVPTCLDELWRVLKPGGRLLLGSPNLCSPFFALGDLVNLARGRAGRPVFATSWPAALGWLGRNIWLTQRKWFQSKPDWRYRQPDLSDEVVGGDADSVYLACPIDLERHFRAKRDAHILQLSIGGRDATKLLARVAPRWAPFIGLVVEKRQAMT
jgi:SAM-dependent methyltransferase